MTPSSSLAPHRPLIDGSTPSVLHDLCDDFTAALDAHHAVLEAVSDVVVAERAQRASQTALGASEATS